MRITANKIDEWANTLECRGKLPLLIRKLIYESINDLSKCKFPSLEQTTSSSGFDGILESNEKTQYIPKGVSVWEMGCNKDKNKKTKADDDYDKRKKDPLNTTPKETVYIQVSPRVWKDEKIKEWCDEKKQEQFWKNVILLDAKDLEEWINNTPTVEQWFAEELGLPNEGVETLNQWWRKWSSVASNINFTSDLILTNKEEGIETLKKYLETSKQVIVKSSTMEESIAFLYSVLCTFPITEREYYLNKTLIIDNPRSFDYYSQYDLILIPTFDITYTNSNSFVYIPVSNENLTDANITLNDLIKFDMMNCLNKSMKIPLDLSKKYANECGGNISILRCILSPKSVTPPWFDENLTDILITLFIVQSWNENNSNDIKVIENISGLTYEEFTRKLMILLNKPNTPLIKNQNIWMLKFPPYLFFLVAPYLTKFDIDNQYTSFLELFKISNYTNGFLKEKYSRNLKTGISKSIILIDIYGNNSNLKCKPITIWKLIEKTFENEDKLFWIYNTPYLPLFAEISPEWFVENVKKTLKENKEHIEILFKGENYVYLLSSLEICSRNPSLFNSVVDILIDLNNIEYHDRLHNSPFNSLKELFIPWRNYNSDFLQIRLKKLDNILNENKELGWKLLEFLLGRESKSSFGIKNPIYRDFTTTHKPITQKEINEYNFNIEEKTIEYLVDDDIDKYCFLIRQYCITPNKKYKHEIIENLENYGDSENSVILWNEILDEIYLMKRANIKKEKYTKTEIEKLEKLSQKFKPEDLIKRSEWAFNDHIIRTSSLKDKIEDMKLERHTITSNIIEELGFEGIKNLIQNIRLPEILAEYVSEYDFDDEVLGLLNSNENNTHFASAYIWKKSRGNYDWTEKTFEKIKTQDDEYLITFFVAIFPNEKNWELLNSCSQVVIDEYWKHCSNYSYKTKEGIINHINNLIKHSRYIDAVKSLSHNLEELETIFIGDTLLSISDKVEDEIGKNDYIFDIILKKLHENGYDRTKLIKLEFMLSECYQIVPPEYTLVIHDEISKNAELFCCLINNLDHDRNCVYRCMIILDSFNIIPGTNEEGEIDIDVLRKWIKDCESKAKDSYFLYYYLAKLFANTPENNDNWPKEEICQTIDELDNNTLNNEFSVAIFNKRGIFEKDIFDGGNQEIELAKKYQKYANNILHNYPITAKSLIEASERFYESAKFEDYRAINNKWRF